MGNTKEYNFGYARVRIHPGKLAGKEQRRVHEDAARKLLKEVQKAHKNKAV